MPKHNPPNKHHFSPAFYLAAWAASDGDLTVFRRPAAKIVAHRKHPNAIGFMPGLYSAGGVNYEESYFRHFDTRASGLFQRLSKLSGGIRLSRSDRETLSSYIAMANVRTPEDLQAIQHGISRAIDAGIPEMEEWFASDEVNAWFEARGLDKPNSFADYAKSEYSDDEIREVGINSITRATSFDSVIQLLYSLSFYVFSFKMDCELMTCDRPVLFSTPVLPDGYVRFPIGPHRLLLGYRNPRVLSRLRHMSGTRLALETNVAICSAAIAMVFARDDQAFAFVEEHMSKNAKIAPYLTI